MTVPFRKDEADAPEMTTADLAIARSTSEASLIKEEVDVGRLKPLRSERSATDFPASSHRDTTGFTEATTLFPEDQLHDLQARWNDIQTYFVDEPRSAVQKADSLVASTMQQLAEAFSRERSNLEQQWDRGDNISTEDLRVAFPALSFLLPAPAISISEVRRGGRRTKQHNEGDQSRPPATLNFSSSRVPTPAEGVVTSSRTPPRIYSAFLRAGTI